MPHSAIEESIANNRNWQEKGLGAGGLPGISWRSIVFKATMQNILLWPDTRLSPSLNGNGDMERDLLLVRAASSSSHKKLLRWITSLVQLVQYLVSDSDQ